MNVKWECVKMNQATRSPLFAFFFVVFTSFFLVVRNDKICTATFLKEKNCFLIKENEILKITE